MSESLPVEEKPSRDATDTSVASSSTQTRFSFYNAQDFVQKSSPRKSPKDDDNNNNNNNNSSNNNQSNRFHFNEKKPPSVSDETVQILRSLKEHEQQRHEILSHTSSSTTAQQQQAVAVAPPTSSSPTFCNPYEDAIKEALDLLRKHRTTPKSPPGTTTSAPPTLHTSFPDDNNTTKEEEELEELINNDSTNKTLNNNSVLLTPAVSDGGLGEAYQAEIEARRKQRQQRMARYATRLAELKQTSNKQSNNNNNKKKEQQEQPSSETKPRSHVGSVSTITATRSTTKDEEVQRGVERVLLAILERANSRGRAAVMVQQSSSKQSSWGEEEKKNTAQEENEMSGSSVVLSDENNNNNDDDDDDEDALVAAMTDLLGSKSSMSSTCDEEIRDQLVLTELINELGGGISQETNNGDTTSPLTDPQRYLSAASDSVASAPAAASLESLLDRTDPQDPVLAVRSDPGADAEDLQAQVAQKVRDKQEEADELDKMVLSVLSGGGESTVDSYIGSPTALRANKTVEKIKDDSIDQRVRRILSNTRSEDDDDDDDDSTSKSSRSEDTSDSETDEGEDDTIESKSNYDDSEDVESEDEDSYTEDDESDSDSDNHEDLDGVLGPLSKKAGGTTGVVLEHSPEIRPSVSSPSILDSLSAAVSMMTGGSIKSQEEEPDKYSPEYVENDERDGDESAELMRSLCAHLLPFGVDQSSRLLDNRPGWNESDSDEPGYRIIRLTNGQLQGVEKAFERMVNGLKDDSERNLKNGPDTSFERDLQAAEELLDREEKRLKETEHIVDHAEKTISNQPDLSAETEHEISESECLVDFPGVRPTGKGEMGDLEFFHLPVIFKSHVTGFEPTKDLVLEPGNVVAGQYLVEGELGSAAFSTAYRCIDLNKEDEDGEHEEVCLKVIKNTKDFFDQSLDEIKILELLRQTGRVHENYIVEMKAFFYHREHLIIVTELLRQNLFEFGKFIIDNHEEPYFTISRLGYITRQVLIALRFVHKLGLVHSDIKPENILLGSYSRAKAKVIDFGSSCYLTDRQSSYIQSRSYRAPEVILGLPYDGRIDVWSLGCVIAEMYTGEVTFQNDSIVSMMSRIEAICGPFPRHMIAQGRQSSRFFTKCGLLYEKVSSPDDSRNESGDDSEEEDDERRLRRFIDIFQPKTTTLSTRLGFASDLMEQYDCGGKLSKEQRRAAVFVDFVRTLLTIDPDARPTAAQALEHPWMQYAATLTEDDILYPSS